MVNILTNTLIGINVLFTFFFTLIMICVISNLRAKIAKLESELESIRYNKGV